MSDKMKRIAAMALALLLVISMLFSMILSFIG